MKLNFFKFLLILLVITPLLTRCTLEDPIKQEFNRFIQSDPVQETSDRLISLQEPIPFYRFKTGNGTAENDLTFQLEYLLESMEVEGEAVQASHLKWNEGQLYLTYNKAGDMVRGGFEVLDFSRGDQPSVHAIGSTDKEYSSVDLVTDPQSGARQLLLAGALTVDVGQVSAILQIFNLDINGYPLLAPETHLLQGHVATDVNQLGIVSGTQGAFYRINTLNGNALQFMNAFNDARSLALDPATGRYAVLLGSPGALITGLPDAYTEIPLVGNQQPESKSIVRIELGYAFAAMGEGGLHVIDMASGKVSAVLQAPDLPPGGLRNDYVTNGVSVSKSGYVFVANGAAGLYVANLLADGSLEVLGYLDLQASVNYVESAGNRLFAAAGSRGVAVINISGLPAELPVVSTSPIEPVSLTPTSVSTGGQVLSDGGEAITSRGICYATTPDPDLNDAMIESGSGMGPFTTLLHSLLPSTTYYYRAYATNPQGTAYGLQKQFITPAAEESDLETFVDLRDGKTYRMVTIGAQTWMADNLAWLPEVGPAASGSQIAPYYYVYDYNGFDVSEAKQSMNYTKYGVLYNWEAAMIACPDGWRLPDDQDFKTLEMHLGMLPSDADRERFRVTGDVALKLKSLTGWRDGGGGDGSTGFNAPASGYRARGGPFSFAGNYAAFWTSDQLNGKPIYRALYYFNQGVYRSTWNSSGGLSVRCVR